MEVPFVLIGPGGIFTVYNRFVNLTAFRHALDVVRGKFDDPNHKGEVSHFQALTAAARAPLAWATLLGWPWRFRWAVQARRFG